MSEKKHHKEEKPVEKMTIKELREIAIEIPHEHTEVAVRDMNKEQLVDFIRKSRGMKEEEAVHHETKKKGKARILLTKQQIKANIRNLKQEKASAYEQNDRENASVLRRRISKLKKLSRKAA